MEVAHTSNRDNVYVKRGGVYVQCRWHRRVRPIRVQYKPKGAKMAFTFNEPKDRVLESQSGTFS